MDLVLYCTGLSPFSFSFHITSTIGIMHKKLYQKFHHISKYIQKISCNALSFIVIYTQNPARQFLTGLAHSCMFSLTQQIEVHMRHTERAVCVYGKEVFLLVTQNVWRMGFKGINKTKRGAFESPFFVDYKSGMGYTLLRRTNP